MTILILGIFFSFYTYFIPIRLLTLKIKVSKKLINHFYYSVYLYIRKNKLEKYL